MNDRPAQPAPAFGGPWTEEKLDILERYLDAYTTALKDQLFRLWYIDAFAGAGRVELPAEDQDDVGRFLSGSAERAIGIGDKPFDKLIFVERDPSRCAGLATLHAANRSRDIVIENSEANIFLSNLDDDWRGRRGVLFLDPFATELNWSTLVRVASFQALDTWILFPVSAISRMLPQSRQPDEIDEKWVARLTAVFGNESWRGLYRPSIQTDLFLADTHERDSGTDGLLDIYKGKLFKLFGNRFLQQSRPLMNSKNSKLFEFLFCAGHPRGANIAKGIAGHILENL